MFVPLSEIAQTHTDQLRREADAWRTRREARHPKTAVSLPQQRRER